LAVPAEQTSAEETVSPPVTLKAPAAPSAELSITPEPLQTEVADALQSAADEQAQPNEIDPGTEAPVLLDVPSLSPSELQSAEPANIQQDESIPTNASEQPEENDLQPPLVPEPEPQTLTLPEPPKEDELQPPSLPEPPIVKQAEPDLDTRSAESSLLPLKETAKQRRKREAEEWVQREEQEELDQKNFEQYRIDQERLEMARLEQKRLERERNRQERARKERLEQERLEAERAEQERVEKERLEKVRLEEERLEQERLEQERLEEERLIKERLEQHRLEHEARKRERIAQEEIERQKLEKERIEQERLDAERLREEELEKTRLDTLRIENERLQQKLLEEKAEAIAKAAEAAGKGPLQIEVEVARALRDQHVQTSDGEVDIKSATGSLTSSVPLERLDLTAPAAPAEPTQLLTSGPETHSQRAVGSSDARTSNPVSRLPTPATSVGRSGSPRSATVIDSPRARPYTSEMPPQHSPAHRSEHVDQISQGRHTTGSPALPAPRPQAVSQIIQDSRPAAPSPPVGRTRPRHIPAFDSEDESDSSAMVRPRRQFRGGEDFSRDELSGSAQYPPQPTHHRSFASRVPPAEPSYSNPPPPQPPGYHPGYYPPTAPPHYQNHNYRVSQQGYPHPNAYGPPSHSSSSPYTEPWNYPPGYRHDSPPHRHDTLITRDYPLGLSPLDTRSAPGADPGDVFSRIAQAIPDLHVLLAQYKETHGQLSVREELLRRSSVEQDERLRAKDHEITDLKERARTLEHQYSTEASRLRLQIGNLEEQVRELQDQRAETEKFKREALETRAALEAAMKSWEAKYKELEVAHAALARTSYEEKANFDEWKSSTTTRHDAENIALAIQFDKRLKEADVLAESRRQELVVACVKEKEELKLDHQRQQLERQASFDRMRSELEAELHIAQKDREEALIQERESREVWLAEREALIKAHQDDRESIQRSWEEQRDLLEAHYRKSKDESDKAWIELHADSSTRAEEERARVDQLIKEKEELQKRYNALRAESEQEKSIIKSVASNLESEKSRLEKLMECYGDIAEIKSKGDTY
jgi:serine/arginine repetitive matrix protein 2